MDSKFRTVLFLLVLIGLRISLPAQFCDSLRYRWPLYSVQKDSNIVYGNAQSIPAVYVSESVTIAQDLKLDLYQPLGDTLSRRPLLLFAFGGGFLIGSKEDEDARALCDSFARKGFVTASIAYRLNLNVLDASSGERAVYRGTQDWSAAIRWCKEKADSLRIDTNYIFAGGVSAGSFGAMHCQFMEEAERPASTYAQGFPSFAPDLGCKNCSGNNFNHSTRVKALINCWGAVGDTNWIDAPENLPMISFHGDIDPVVPYGYGFPFTTLLLLPPVYGSEMIHARRQHLGHPNAFVPFPGEGHNVWGTVVSNQFVPGPTQYWNPILEDIRDFLYPMLQPSPPAISGNGFVPAATVATYTVPVSSGAHWCWQVNGGIIQADNGNSIDVLWQTPGLGNIRCQAFNQLDAASNSSHLPVVVGTVALEDQMNEGLEARIQGSQLHMQSDRSESLTLDLLDLSGRLLSSQEIRLSAGIASSHDLGWQSAGYYFLRLHSSDRHKVLIWNCRP